MGFVFSERVEIQLLLYVPQKNWDFDFFSIFFLIVVTLWPWSADFYRRYDREFIHRVSFSSDLDLTKAYAIQDCFHMTKIYSFTLENFKDLTVPNFSEAMPVGSVSYIMSFKAKIKTRVVH